MRRLLFVAVICVLFTLPLATTPVSAGHALVGNRTDYCTPCGTSECGCDAGELPGGSLVTEQLQPIARPESKSLTVVAITALLLWIRLGMRA